jgi:hypothetical protein
VTQTVKAQFQPAHPAETGLESFRFQVLSELPREAPDVTVQNIGLGPGSVAAIVGPPNVSKTTLAVRLALSVALGEDFFGLKTQRGVVAYFAPEAPRSVGLRAHAAMQRNFPDRRAPFYLISETPALGADLYTETDTLRMIATIRDIQSNEGEAVRLSFVDTLASCLSGGEENGTGMILIATAAKRIAAETETCVILLHHPPKGDGKGLRGHGSLAAAVDTIIELSTDEPTGIRTATLTKSRDTATGLQLHYELEVVTMAEIDQWGEPLTTVVIKAAEQEATSKIIKATGANQQRALTALREWARTHTDEPMITSGDIKELLTAHRIGRARRPEVLDFLSRSKVLTPSVAGYLVNREFLL